MATVNSIWKATKRAYSTFRSEMRGNMQRAYKVAQVDRLTANWPITQISAKRELRQSLRAIRNRIRILAQNDDFIKKYLGMSANNIAGPKGFTLQLTMKSETGQPDAQPTPRDEQIIRELKEAFEEWSHKEYASASTRQSWLDQQRLFARNRRRDGEVLIRRILTDSPFGFALRFIDVAWLDEFYNDTLPGGNRVIMSVEVDQNDRPIAYWLTMPAAEYMFNVRRPGERYRQRIDASEFIHAFVVVDDDSQVRGVPEPHTAALSLKVLDDYEYAELTGAYVDACKMPYLVPPANADGQPSASETEITGANGDPIPVPIQQQIEPAIQQILPAGWDVKPFAPSHPNSNYSDFNKAVLRRAASGLEVSYASLSNDLEGANYSSLKAGQQEERAVWRYEQSFEVEHLCRIVWRWFLQFGMLTGRLTLTASEATRVVATWRPRGWPSIEPLKEIQATILGINNFLDSHIDDAAEHGEDWEDIVRKLARAKELIEAAGLKVDPVVDAALDNNAKKHQSTEDPEDPEEEKDDGTNRVLPMLRHQLRPAT